MDDIGLDPPRTRRTQAERREATKARLLEAATELLREKGLGGFRTADVVERAGVSKGALLHHFPTKDALIVAVFEQLYRAVDEAAARPARARSLAQLIEDLVAESHAFFFGDSFEVSLNITVAAAREPELKDAVFAVVRRFRKHTEEVWIDRLSEQGVPSKDAVEAVWLINSLVRGLAVRAIWEPDQHRFRALERAQARLVLQHLQRAIDSAR
jgi:AcrR family transcriptional regulator